MAVSKSFMSSFIMIYFFLSIIQAHSSSEVVTRNNAMGRVSLADNQIDCGGECTRRCQLSSRPNLCNRACGTCCARCNCVPPGTYGNYDACPCYANMTTHGGRRKCP